MLEVVAFSAVAGPLAKALDGVAERASVKPATAPPALPRLRLAGFFQDDNSGVLAGVQWKLF